MLSLICYPSNRPAASLVIFSAVQAKGRVETGSAGVLVLTEAATVLEVRSCTADRQHFMARSSQSIALELSYAV
jgi:hypothetical protein